MLPGRRTDTGAIYVTQGPPPAGTPLVGGIAVSPAGVIYASQSVVPVFSPLDLFSAGEQGVFFDPSDLSTMFQDSAGGVPVTADGQPVGLILDKSGRNNHASQATAAKRPLYKTDGTLHWLQFDGVDDFIGCTWPTIPNASTLFTGAMRASAASCVMFTPVENDPSRFICVAQAGSTQRPDGNVEEPKYNINGLILSPVERGAFDTALGISTAKVISVEDVNLSVLPWLGFGVGAYSGFSAPLNIYSLIVLGRLATTQEITDTETWVAAKTGVVLP